MSDFQTNTTLTNCYQYIAIASLSTVTAILPEAQYKFPEVAFADRLE